MLLYMSGQAKSRYFRLDFAIRLKQDSQSPHPGTEFAFKKWGKNNKTNQDVLRFGVMIVLRIKLDRRKALEAAAVLTGGSPDHKINRKRLLALLYIANREWFKRTGRPLLGGRLAAMRHGPIHADVYDLVNERKGTAGLDEWARHFHNESYFVILDRDPGVNALSRGEVKLLTDTLHKYENEDDWDVARRTHKYSEYHVTYQSGKSRTISIEKMIQALRLTPMEKTILRDLKEKEGLDKLFADAEKGDLKR